MELTILLKGLGEAAKNPFAFAAYAFVVLCWAVLAYKNNSLKHREKLAALTPAKDRLKAIKATDELKPKTITEAGFYRNKRLTYLLLGFLALLFAALIVGVLTIVRYTELDKANVVNETMRLGYKAFIRSTTTADDNNFEKSIGKLEESLRLNPSYAGYVNLGELYEAISEPDKAIIANKEAHRLDATNPSPLNAIGMLLKDQGRLEEAESYLQEAMKLFKAMPRNQSDDAEFLVTLLVNTGNVYYELADQAADAKTQERYARKALDECYTPALEQRGRISNQRFLANLIGNAANAYRILANYQKAEEMMFESIAMKDSINRKSESMISLGIGYLNMTDIYLATGELDKAERYLKLSDEIISQSDYELVKGAIELNKAELSKKRGDLVEARSCAEKARKVFAKNNLGLYEKKASEMLLALSAVK